MCGMFCWRFTHHVKMMEPVSLLWCPIIDINNKVLSNIHCHRLIFTAILIYIIAAVNDWRLHVRSLYAAVDIAINIDNTHLYIQHQVTAPLEPGVVFRSKRLCLHFIMRQIVTSMKGFVTKTWKYMWCDGRLISWPFDSMSTIIFIMCI